MIKKHIFFTLLLLILTTTLCFGAEAKQGTISGKWITKDNGPMTGAQVLLFNLAVGPPPSSDKFLRVPDVTTTIDVDGKFSVQVAAGRYYLVMRKRVEEGTFGPPRDGDLQFYSRDKKGMARLFVVKAGKETNLGTITEVTVFQKQQSKYEKGMTAIEGTVTGEDGQPVEGVRVFAYTSPEMKGRPQYASEGTGKDGKYLINVNKQGTYYLKARSHYGGGKPVKGEFMGGYGEPTAPAVVEVEKGTLRSGIDIKTRQFAEQGRPQ
ncbi:MAG: carboxypeptidase regulatory-like domain-containing protein [Verrucomicrobia bacterium]|nr:carboxypeptidase regulatory-like domain-containing protein [Deltaproteobacteria bacterium]